MATGLTLTISFLARYIGLGGIPDKIKGVIGKVKKPVDKAVSKATGWIASKVKVLVGKVKGGFEKVKGLFGGKNSALAAWRKKNPKESEKLNSGLTQLHTLARSKAIDGKITRGKAEEVVQQVRKENSVFKRLEVIDREDRWDYNYTVNPDVKEDGEKKAEKTIKWGNWESSLAYGHTFSMKKHSSKIKPESLIDRARSDGKQKGQWADNEQAAIFLSDAVQGKYAGRKGLLPDIDLPADYGHAYLPNGEKVKADKCRIILKSSGDGTIKTAFPINSKYPT